MMKKIIAFAFLCIACSPKNDDLSRSVDCDPPKRLASLTPALTRILIETGHRESIVAVTKESLAETGGAKVSVIGSFGHTDFERLLATKPDLAIYQNIDATTEEALRKFRLEALRCNLDTLENIEKCAEDIDAAFCKRRNYRIEIKKIFSSNAKSMIVVGSSDDLSTIYIAQNQSYLAQGIRACGLSTVDDGTNKAWSSINAEGLLRLRPDIILHLDVRGRDKDRIAELYRKTFPSLKSHIVVYDGKDMMLPSPGIGSKISEMCETIDKRIF